MENLSLLAGDRVAKQEGASLSFPLLCLWLLLIFLRPQDFFPWVESPLHLPLAVLLICVLAHVATAGDQRRAVFALTPETKVLFLLTFWAVATAPLAYWVRGALQTLYQHWGKVVALYLVLGNAVRSVKQLRRVVWLCLLSATCVALTGTAVRLLVGRAATVGGRLEALVSGPYSGSNYLATTILLFLPFALLFFLLHERPVVRLLSGAIAALIAAATLLTQSRSGFLTMLFIFAAVLWKVRYAWRKRVGFAVAVFALAGLPLLLFFGKGVALRYSAIFGDYSKENLSVGNPIRMALGSYDQRVQMMSHAAFLTLTHPLTGVGIGNFSGADAKTFFTGRSADWTACHNAYLQFASELGLPGILLYLVIVWLILKRLRQTRTRIPPETTGRPELRYLALLCDATTIGLYGYLINSAFANTAYNSYFFLLAGFAEAMWLMLPALNIPAKVPQPTPQEEGKVWWPDFTPAGREVRK